MKVIFSDRAYASILAETTEKIKTETGGLFLGTIKDDVCYVVEAIDPGPKSIFEVAYFEYDQKYTQHLINKVANLYDKKLSLVGLWHRHPGSFDQFSSTDNGTNTKYASLNPNGAISALVNIDPKFRLTVYHVGKPCRYSKISYDVGDNLIPDEYLKFKSLDRFNDMMDKLLYPSRSSQNGYHRSVSLSSFMEFIASAIKDKICTDAEANNLINSKEAQEQLTDEILDDLSFLADSVGVEVSLALNDGYLMVYQEAIDKTTKLYFMTSIIKDSVVFSYEDKCYLYHSGLLKESYERSKEKKDSENTVNNVKVTEKQNGVIDTVIKMIKFNRNEE